MDLDKVAELTTRAGKLSPLFKAAQTKFVTAVQETISEGSFDPADDGVFVEAGRAWWALYNEMESIRMGVIEQCPPGDVELFKIVNLTDPTIPAGEERHIPLDRLAGYQLAGWSKVD